MNNQGDSARGRVGKILVTGGTGFLGSYIIKELIEKGHSVRAIRRGNKLPFYIPKEILDKVQWMDGDILDVVALEDAMDDIDTVIHSAGVVSFVKKERKRMYRVNVEGTANIVNIALEKNVRRLIYVSSVAALGRTTTGGTVNEERKWELSKANTHYAKSKHNGELEVWRGISEGLNGVILNPSTILGFGDWNSSSCAIFKKIYDEFNWYTPGINGFVGVEDVARVVSMLLESDISGQRFIVNSDNWSFKKLMDTIADSFGKKKPSRQSTPFLLGLAWKMEELKSLLNGSRPLLTRESAKVAVSKTYFENDKLLAAFPEFLFTPLEQTIRQASAKYLETAGRRSHYKSSG
jgi:nucleoside-diphosphate-sugar epimerase